jgi:hypothetical protein
MWDFPVWLVKQRTNLVGTGLFRGGMVILLRRARRKDE